MLSSKLSVLLITLMMFSAGEAGPLAYAACQTVCNGIVVACYAGAGLTFGTVTAGVGTPIAAIVCNLGQSACMAACAPTLTAPTP